VVTLSDTRDWYEY